MNSKLKNQIIEAVDNILPDVIQFRQTLHQYPEIGFEEHETTKLIKNALAESNIELLLTDLETGVLAEIKGENPGKTIALRADIDGIHLNDTSGVEYCSRYSGLSHGCGHDGHAASLLGAAIVLDRIKYHLKGSVKLIFQPAEETGIGAQKVIDTVGLDKFGISTFFTIHSWPYSDVGIFAVKTGAMTAANEIVEIHLKGHGGHGARFHETKNPLLVAALLVPELYNLSNRDQGDDSVIVSIGACHAGRLPNVIPAHSTLKGTIRTYKEDIRQAVHENIEKIVDKYSAQEGVTYKIDYKNYCPAVNNDEALVATFQKVVKDFFGDQYLEELDTPSLGSEDFGSYLEHAPGLLVRLGMGTTRALLHNGKFDFNDDALKNGILIYVLMALEMLGE